MICWRVTLVPAVSLSLFLSLMDKTQMERISDVVQVRYCRANFIQFLIFELRNESNIFSVDRGINRKKNGKHQQQCATSIDAVFCPFLVDTSINWKNTVYQFFSVCIHFSLCSREYQNGEKFNRINLTQSCKWSRF